MKQKKKLYVRFAVIFAVIFSVGCVFMAACGNKNDTKDTEPAHTHSYSVTESKDATCTEDGYVTYTCECGDTYTETVKSAGHTWNKDTVTKEATCTAEGETTYTCSVCGETKTEAIPMTEHTYVEKDITWDWTWNEDKGYTDVTATVKCSICQTGTTVDGTITSKPADGIYGDYTATAELGGKTYSDTKTAVDKGGSAGSGEVHTHIYGTPTWTWDEENYSYATATFTCTDESCPDEDGQKTVEVKAEGNGIQQTDYTAPTCGTAGSCKYKATVSFGGKEYTDTTAEISIPATGEHEYSDIDENNITWSWSSDYSSCTASVTMSCKNCEAAATYEATCTVTEGTTVPSTCATPGYTEYTATAILNGQTYYKTVQASLELAAHTYPANTEDNQTSGYITWVWTNKNDNTGTVQLTIQCPVCGGELFNQDVSYTITKHADYNEYSATITVGDVTYTSAYTETADNHLVTDAEIWAELFPEGSEDDIEITLGANLTDSGSYEISDPLWYVLYYDTDTRAVTIDLNGYTLDMSAVPDSYYVNGNDLTFKNGTLVLPDFSLWEGCDEDNYTESDWYTWSQFTVSGGALTFDEVTVEGARGCVVYAGENSVINIIDSSISTTGAYVVGTNASTSYSCEINITGSNLTASSVYNDGTAVLVNAPQTIVTITGSVLQGDVQGLVVRGGTAVVKSTSIVLSGKYTEGSQSADNAYSETYGASNEVAWGSGNNVPYAAIVVGNNHTTSYQYPTNVTFENVTVCTSGISGVAWYLYVYSSSAACAVTISVDGDCNFAVGGFGLTYTNDDNSGPVYVGYSNDGVVVITGADVTVAAVNTVDTLLEALSGEGEITITVTEDIADDDGGSLLNAFNKTLAGEGTELTIDLGSNELTLGKAGNSLTVGTGNSLTITGEKDFDGNNTAKLVAENITGTNLKAYGSTANIDVEAEASLTLVNVDVETNSTGVFVQRSGELVVEGSNILSYGMYGIGTNNLYSGDAVITLRDSSVTVEKPDDDTSTTWTPRTAVFVNVPCELTIKNCVITSTFQGVVVRGGTASITDTKIVITEDFTNDTQSSTGYENYYFEGYDASSENSWGTANALPHAGVVIGNNGDSAYDAATDVVLSDVAIELSSKNAWAVYAYSCSSDIPVSIIISNCDFTIEYLGNHDLAEGLHAYCGVSDGGSITVNETPLEEKIPDPVVDSVELTDENGVPLTGVVVELDENGTATGTVIVTVTMDQDVPYEDVLTLSYEYGNIEIIGFDSNDGGVFTLVITANSKTETPVEVTITAGTKSVVFTVTVMDYVAPAVPSSVLVEVDFANGNFTKSGTDENLNSSDGTPNPLKDSEGSETGLYVIGTSSVVIDNTSSTNVLKFSGAASTTANSVSYTFAEAGYYTVTISYFQAAGRYATVLDSTEDLAPYVAEEDITTSSSSSAIKTREISITATAGMTIYIGSKTSGLYITYIKIESVAEPTVLTPVGITLSESEITLEIDTDEIEVSAYVTMSDGKNYATYGEISFDWSFSEGYETYITVSGSGNNRTFAGLSVTTDEVVVTVKVANTEYSKEIEITVITHEVSTQTYLYVDFSDSTTYEDWYDTTSSNTAQSTWILTLGSGLSYQSSGAIRTGGGSKSDNNRAITIDLRDYQGQTLTIAVSMKSTGSSAEDRYIYLDTSSPSSSAPSGGANYATALAYAVSKNSSDPVMLYYSCMIANDYLYLTYDKNIDILSIEISITESDAQSEYSVTVSDSALTTEGTATIGVTDSTGATMTGDLTYEVSKSGVVTVENGTITAVGEGTVTVIVKHDGKALGAVTITVSG